MPTSQDVAKFTKYLYTKVLESQQNYLDVESKANYRALQESILIYLIVFNKKRGKRFISFIGLIEIALKTVFILDF